MLEKQRLTYLEHLGIDNYMPTRVLSNAKPSSLLPDELLQSPDAFSTADLPQTDNQSAAPSSSAPLADSPAALLAAIGAEPADSPQVSETAAPEVVVDKPVEPEEAAPVVEPSAKALVAEEIRFSLSIWRVNDVLIVDSRQPASALPTDRLLQNMLRSVGYSLAQLPSSELVRWPLFSGQSFGQETTNERAEAAAMVQAYIGAQCQKAPVSAIWLMGQEATQFATSEDNNDVFEEKQGSCWQHEPWQTLLLAMPSLHTMLMNPNEKKVAWQALQAMLARQA